MGMFDYVKCSAPLPGEPPAFVGPGHRFQTKDLDCTLAEYEITADGRMVLSGREDAIDFDGDVNFYDTNCVGASINQDGMVHFTEDGEDAEFVEYVARFADGRLTGIEEVDRTRWPAHPASERGRK